MPDFWQPAAFCRPRLRNGAALPLSALERLGPLLAQAPLGAPGPGLAEVREAYAPESLGEFAWDLLSAWLSAGAPIQQIWAYHALAVLGDDDCMRRLMPLLAEWTRQGQHLRSRPGRLPRAELRPALLPRRLRRAPAPLRAGRRGEAPEGPPRPRPGRRPGAVLHGAGRWKALKKDIKAVAGLHRRRLEKAMFESLRCDVAVKACSVAVDLYNVAVNGCSGAMYL